MKEHLKKYLKIRRVRYSTRTKHCETQVSEQKQDDEIRYVFQGLTIIRCTECNEIKSSYKVLA